MDKIISILFYVCITALTLSPTAYYLYKLKVKKIDSIWLTKDPLHNQPLFWISLTTPICLFISFSIPYLIEYNFSLYQISNLKTFLEALEKPFWVLASVIPIVALLVGAHRSVQTDAQIRESEEQNWLNIVKNRKNEFKKYIDNSTPCNSIEFHEKMYISSAAFTHLFYINNKERKIVKSIYYERIESNFFAILNNIYLLRSLPNEATCNHETLTYISNISDSLRNIGTYISQKEIEKLLSSRTSFLVQHPIDTKEGIRKIIHTLTLVSMEDLTNISKVIYTYLSRINEFYQDNSQEIYLTSIEFWSMEFDFNDNSINTRIENQFEAHKY